MIRCGQSSCPRVVLISVARRPSWNAWTAAPLAGPNAPSATIDEPCACRRCCAASTRQLVACVAPCFTSGHGRGTGHEGAEEGPGLGAGLTVEREPPGLLEEADALGGDRPVGAVDDELGQAGRWDEAELLHGAHGIAG